MERARFDWLAELIGASALGLAAGYSALKAAPTLAVPGPAAMTMGSVGLFALGLVAMRSVQPAPRSYALPDFDLAPVAADELLLDKVHVEPLLLDDVLEEPDVLLLDDPIPAAPPDSRVVQLFSPPMPTAGELMDRIDRHLAGSREFAVPSAAPPVADASQALYAALDELKRSLR